MGKRSSFARRPQDAYLTKDPRCVAALLPHLAAGRVKTFAEPCAGELDLVMQLTHAGLKCLMSSDISWNPGFDALQADLSGVDAIITNPPWTREILHPMIQHFVRYAPTWLLFDSDWAYNKAASPYLALCTDIVVVGRVKWIENTKHQGKDNVSWYRFASVHTGVTQFWGRR